MKRSRARAISPLMRKQLRDLRNGWKSFLVVLIICALAVMLFVGIDSTWRAIDRDLRHQFEISNMADLWLRGRVSGRTMWDVQAIPGVSLAQRRIVSEYEGQGLKEDPKLTLVMNEEEPLVCLPIVREGKQPTEKNDIMLSEKFAKAQGLKLGDTLKLIKDNQTLELHIVGLGNMPEYVVANDGQELAPSPLHKGYAFAAPGTLDFLPYTEIAMTLEPDADIHAVRLRLQTLLDERQTVIIQRDDVPGIKMALEQAQQIKAMSVVFPIVFFLVAALITWTTMNRLVEKQRLQIGALFALGFGRRELTWHYTGYGILLAALGLLFGLLGARLGIAPLLMNFINTNYALPDAVPRMSPWVILVIGLILIVITGGASMLSAAKALRLSPASLMRPKPPTKGKRIFLENFKALWNKIPFSEKMILRNMFRKPVRLLLGLLGAIGCSALMLAGFGLRDSVDQVMFNHYTKTMHYDARVSLDSPVPRDYTASIALRAGAQAFEEEMITSAEVFVKGEWRVKQLYVLTDGQDMIRLKDTEGEAVNLPSEGITLTVTAAEDYGLVLGDKLSLRFPGGRRIEAEVVRIIQLQLDQGIYLSRSAWDKLYLGPWRPSTVLLAGNKLDIETVASMDAVSKVRTIQEESDASGTLLAILNIIVLLLVLFSGVLELLVFYNLGQLNFSERIRELATLKVLGFLPREIKKLVLRENIIITLMGLPFGLALGVPLLMILLSYGLPKTILFIPYVAPLSWVYTISITILFSLIVNLILGTKFKKIEMVESLKSIE